MGAKIEFPKYESKNYCPKYGDKIFVPNMRAKTFVSNDICSIELFEIKFSKIEMFDHLIVRKQMTDVTLLVLDSNTWNHLTVCKQTINSK